ncbi:hypothetical protein JCM19274_425 [Algibacter lectus]|uniref:Uncharacterized protein n=1 Tax=Algibacter lectus TaxID=221126 RepID=A0A090WWT8_9FLAO|nr:hypothetical protein JCM19274_425 [Algibacter lectus]
MVLQKPSKDLSSLALNVRDLNPKKRISIVSLMGILLN